MKPENFAWMPVQRLAYKDLLLCAIQHGCRLKVDDGEEVHPSTLDFDTAISQIEAVDEARVTILSPADRKKWGGDTWLNEGTALILLPGPITCSDIESVVDWTTPRNEGEKNLIDLWWDVFFKRWD